MLTVKKLSIAQASTYYSKDNYYTQQIGEYFGKLKDELGLGDLTHDSFQFLLSGINPATGERLIASKKNKDGNVPAYDFTLSPSKSLSAAYEAALERGDTALANKIVKCHDDAVNYTLAHIQKEIIKVRIQKDGKRQSLPTGNIIAGKFQHDINRDLAPQLHTHCVIFNFSKVEDGKYRSIDATKFLKKNSPIIKNLGQFYRSALKDELENQGFEIEIKNKKECFYELSAIGDDVIKAFSQRGEKVKAKVEELKKQFPKMSNSQLNMRAFFNTRVPKKDVNRDDVRSENIKLMAEHVDVDYVLKKLNKNYKNSTIKVDTKEVQKIINDVRAELTKWGRTPLNIATKTLASLPNNSDIKIQTLYEKIKTQEVENQEQLKTMHQVLIHSLKATKLDTTKLFTQFVNNSKQIKLNIEEEVENGKELNSSDRVRLTQRYSRITNQLTEPESSNYRDATNIDTIARERGIESRDQSQGHDVNTDRFAGRSQKPIIITQADIDIAERAGRKYKNQNKGIEQ